MLALLPVETDPAPFVADPISEDEAAAMFRAITALFGKWSLSDD